jgi:hypothetical protein
MIALAAVALLALAGNAIATDVVYYTGDIWAGKTTDVGTITATMHYTADDNASLEIHYATDAGWKMTECHLWIAKKAPASRGAPGQYAYNSGTISTNSYSFSIPIADLKSRLGIDWGSDVYVMPHCALTWVGSGNPPGGETNPTGYGGCIVKPKKGSWFGFFSFGLTKPNEQPRQPYDGLVNHCGYWINFWSPTQVDAEPWHGDQDVLDYLGNGTVVTDGVTLAGRNYKTAADLYAGLTAYEGDFVPWNAFTTQFAALYCNTQLTDGLELAYYDDPTYNGENWENEQVSDLITEANTYTSSTSGSKLTDMFHVFYLINSNSSSSLNCLWDGPMGGSVPLVQAARLTVSPNPFTASTRIRLQSSLQSEARVSVYDLSGKKVNDLTCDQVWNGTDARGQKLAAGVYLLRLVSGAQPVSARAVITR